MRCHVCGGGMETTLTDLPFKVAESSIVIVKGLPVLQCENCREYIIEDIVMERVETILDATEASVELGIVQYAA